MGEEIVLAECAEEEEFNKQGVSLKNVWSPKLELIEALYASIKANKVLELEWKCPGRRDPNQPEENQAEEEPEQLSSMNEGQADDFAFEMEDEPPTTTKNAPKAAKPAGRSMFKSKANTKKTTTLAGILSNMERHRTIEKLAETHISPSPTTNTDS